MPRPTRERRAPPPLDQAALERLAVSYAGRYATTRAKLRLYLERKLAARGWEGAAPPEIAAIVTRMAGLGYVDDRIFAEARAASLGQRGYGARRIAGALRAAGVEGDDAAPVNAKAEEGAHAAALAFARRRRLGPFAAAPSDRDGERRALAAMIRAGHPFAIARAVLRAEREDDPDAQEPPRNGA